MVIDLKKYSAPGPEVKLPSGRVVRVRPVDGHVYHALVRIEERLVAAKQAIERGETTAVEIAEGHELWDLAARCLPDCTPEEVNDLTSEECGIILRIAQGTLGSLLKEIEAQEGKGAPGQPGEPARSPETQSPTSASESPAP